MRILIYRELQEFDYYIKSLKQSRNQVKAILYI